MNSADTSELLTTFFVDGAMFGIEVMKVQEIARKSQIFSVPLAPALVRGLVNLRGQIATAVGLREAFAKSSHDDEEQMAVVCKLDGNLVSLIVDSIGDVLEVRKSNFESPPNTIPPAVKRYVKGIYKMNGTLLSVLDLDSFVRDLSPVSENTSEQVFE